MEVQELSRHLIETESKFDVTEIYDRSGYSPLHFAAYKNNEKMAEILCQFVSLYNANNYCNRYWGNLKLIS